MKIVSVTSTHATVTVPLREVEFLLSAIRETLEALKGSELHTRTGETRETAMAFRSEMKALCDAMENQK